MRWRLLGLCVALLLCLIWSLFQLSRSRQFQVFGTLLAQAHTRQAVVALTFDDGPTAHTPALLALLKQEDVRATFFLVGESLAAEPRWGRLIAAAGHELGNHSYSHRRMVLKSPSWVANELKKTDTLLRATGYTGPLHFRPPYGKKLFVLPWYLARTGRLTVTWSIEPESDAALREDPEKLTQHILTQVQPGAIILLHPMGGYAATRQALPAIIRGLKAKGYQLVTVSELLAVAQQGD